MKKYKNCWKMTEEEMKAYLNANKPNKIIYFIGKILAYIIFFSLVSLPVLLFISIIALFKYLIGILW